MKALTILAFTALLLIAVTGCGQKGPLYLPEDEPATAASGPASE